MVKGNFISGGAVIGGVCGSIGRLVGRPIVDGALNCGAVWHCSEAVWWPVEVDGLTPGTLYDTAILVEHDGAASIA